MSEPAASGRAPLGGRPSPARETQRTRKPAHERRLEVVTAALAHFAHGGYHGTSTEAIARDTGVSQPYLFRLFGTKRELFLACHDAVHARIVETFERAAGEGEAPGSALERMGKAYVALLQDRELLLFQMQSYAACSDPDIRAHVRQRYGETLEIAGRLSGEGPAELWRFFATGMMLNVVASLDLDEISGEQQWAACWASPGAWLTDAGEPPR